MPTPSSRTATRKPSSRALDREVRAALRLGVAHDVGDALLHEAVERDLQVGREALELRSPMRRRQSMFAARQASSTYHCSAEASPRWSSSDGRRFSMMRRLRSMPWSISADEARHALARTAGSVPRRACSHDEVHLRGREDAAQLVVQLARERAPSRARSASAGRPRARRARWRSPRDVVEHLLLPLQRRSPSRLTAMPSP